MQDLLNHPYKYGCWLSSQSQKVLFQADGKQRVAHRTWFLDLVCTQKNFVASSLHAVDGKLADLRKDSYVEGIAARSCPSPGHTMCTSKHFHCGFMTVTSESACKMSCKINPLYSCSIDFRERLQKSSLNLRSNTTRRRQETHTHVQAQLTTH